MYYKLSDFLKDWDYESKATLKIFKAFTDQSLNQKVTPEGRSLGYLAWHIVISVGEMMSKTGLTVNSPDENSDAPASAAEIVSAYEKASSSLVEGIKSNWTDETLNVEDDMYGEKWERGATLGVLITHQIHHRAQLTVLMRQAGLKVPGIYGPSKEEWTAYGMEPQR
jgi:uncharacterized damage-inducible protein DinB